MLKTLQDFFARALAPGLRDEAGAASPALPLATAALLVEMMRMDGRFDARERQSVIDSLRRCFGLAEAELAELVELAEAEARQSTGYYQFTSLINRSCSAEQRLAIVENLWRVAFADGHLDAHEQHLMRKLADLLYVGQADYLAAKQRARDAAAS